MRDKDTILMEQLIQEMGRASYQPLHTRTSDTGMSKKADVSETALNSKDPNVSRLAREEAQRLIIEWLSIMQNSKKAVESATGEDELDDAIGQLCTAGNKILNQTNVIPEQDTFMVTYEGDELSYEQILNKILELTTVNGNDPKSITSTTDNLTGKTTQGKTIRNYNGNKDLYTLYRKVLIKLHQVKGEEAPAPELLNSRELGEEQNLVYYFSNIYNVRDNSSREVVGNWDRQNGFYPNKKGIENGLTPYSYENLKKNIPQGLTADKNPVKLPFVTTLFPPKTGKYTGQALKAQITRRSPRRSTDPVHRAPIVDYSPVDSKDQTFEDIRTLVHHDEAKRAFEEKYPNLSHRKGKVANHIENIKELEEAYEYIFKKRFLKEDDEMKEFEKEDEEDIYNDEGTEDTKECDGECEGCKGCKGGSKDEE